MTDEIRSSWASAILESQSGSPDAVTGATLTFSSASVQEAVEDILLQAVGEKEADPLEERPTEAPVSEAPVTEAPETAQPEP